MLNLLKCSKIYNTTHTMELPWYIMSMLLFRSSHPSSILWSVLLHDTRTHCISVTLTTEIVLLK